MLKSDLDVQQSCHCLNETCTDYNKTTTTNNNIGIQVFTFKGDGCKFNVMVHNIQYNM